jgi:hypothetical protein
MTAVIAGAVAITAVAAVIAAVAMDTGDIDE